MRVLASKAAALEATRARSSHLVHDADLSSAFKFDQMQKRSGLSPSDWLSLLNANDIEAFNTLVIRELSQLPQPNEMSPQPMKDQIAEEQKPAKVVNRKGTRPRK